MNFLEKIIKQIKKYTPGEWLAVFASLFLILSGFFILWVSSLQIPDFKSLQERKVSESTKIYDRTGKILLYDIHHDITRQSVSFENISLYIRNATVAIEDSTFYQNIGIDPVSIMRSVLVDLGARSLKQGGSTITQQVIKNSLLNNNKDFSRKIKEVILALKLDREMSKDDILTIYLNEVPYGGNIYGVEEASNRFFGIDAKDLDLAQSAYLAAIPKAPTYYSPYGNNRTELEARKNLVLDRMLSLGFISKGEHDAAKKEMITFLTQDTGGIKAPHFVEFVKSYLENKYGVDEVSNGGLKVTTTLDWDLEEKAENTVKNYAEQNQKNFGANNAGMVAIDPKTGQLLVMVGSKDYFDTENEGNFNVTIAHRQPGSAFKPFVYATAFNKGYTPETVLFDLKTQFDTNCSPDGVPLDQTTKPEDCYTPVNYDGQYVGPITLRNALAQSRNIPAIKLLYLAGIPDSIQTATNLGITGLGDPNRYGLTLVLGGGEVTLLDMTSAYSVFANDGIRNPYNFILRVEDKDGNILEENAEQSERVLPENTAREISDILSDKNAREPIYGQKSPLDFPGIQVAVKTGTTNDFKDAWIIGYTPNLTVGAWAGNNDDTPMVKKIAGYIVAPMWNNFFSQALIGRPVENFKTPETHDTDSLKPVMKGLWQGGIQYFIDKISGKIATQYTPPETRETKVVTDVHSILYWVNKNDPLGPKLINPSDDPQFNLWETPVLKWANEHSIKSENIDSIPKETDNVHGPNMSPTIKIISPTDKIYSPNEKIPIEISVNGKFPVVGADFFLNNTYLGSTKNPPFSYNFTPSDVQNLSGSNQIRIVVHDSVFNKSEITETFTINTN